MQRESGYYPPGAEFDPRAPWNQDDTIMEKRMEDATDQADAILIDGTELSKFDRDWELWARISWHTLSEAFRDLHMALMQDEAATIRVLQAVKNQRDQLREYMAEKIEGDMPESDPTDI